MIKIIDTSIPNQTNKKIIETLFTKRNWCFGADETINKDINKKDSGFLLNTYNVNFQETNNDNLNIYAELITHIVEAHTSMKFKLERVYWNWYHSESVMNFHQDNIKHNKFSIIYNLHNNDGGTEFKIDDEIKFFKSNESQVLFFPSKLIHRGVASKTSPNRFALNIGLEI
tara:strand:- start:647 stop:1159 length:513 start_codon:yes stop_codon:yes gene_type:complete